MEWEWAEDANHTDWFGASAELVDKVILSHVRPGDGPLLQIGCGDSPLPGLLHKAGFLEAEHIDISAKIVALMEQRYQALPGVTFERRDFLKDPMAGGGPPPPLRRFAVVVDKAGIWDWMQDEAPSVLPQLLHTVQAALRPYDPSKGRAVRPGVYVVATKQTPSELQASLTGVEPAFQVEGSYSLAPLGHGKAWAYVLVPP